MKRDDCYQLIDSGDGMKLERFGKLLLARPCSQAVWKPRLSRQAWQEADASFTREGTMQWSDKRKLPAEWWIQLRGLKFRLTPTDFGHLGVFPEHEKAWTLMEEAIRHAKEGGRDQIHILNLFAYSGGATLAAARAGAHVCHLDASKGMVAWARENAQANALDRAPIRWIIDDVMKFLQREQRRGRSYNGVILDPPSFGRGANGEFFKIEEQIIPLLEAVRSVLSDQPLFVFFSAHTPGFTPIVMQHLLGQVMSKFKGEIASGEMLLQGTEKVLPIPSGSYAFWRNR